MINSIACALPCSNYHPHQGTLYPRDVGRKEQMSEPLGNKWGLVRTSQCILLFPFEDLERPDTAELNQKDDCPVGRETKCDTILLHSLIPFYGDQQIMHLWWTLGLIQDPGVCIYYIPPPPGMKSHSWHLPAFSLYFWQFWWFQSQMEIIFSVSFTFYNAMFAHLDIQCM